MFAGGSVAGFSRCLMPIRWNEEKDQPSRFSKGWKSAREDASHLSGPLPWVLTPVAPLLFRVRWSELRRPGRAPTDGAY